jgi:thymidylate synthase (FAD)
MGSDLTVVNAARVSFNKEHQEFQDNDTKLIQYLAKHNHWTPFGHCTAQFRVKAPIFVARQLVKHQVGLVWNEVSRRYVDDMPEFYHPKEWRGKPINAKQGSSEEIVEIPDGLWGVYWDIYEASNLAYAQLLANGVAPELARIVLPLNTYTEWYWTGSLAAWARVCKLRLDPHAQEETRFIAQEISAYMLDLFPVSWEALLGSE